MTCPNRKKSQMACGRSDGSAFDWVDPLPPSNPSSTIHCSYGKLGTYSGIWDLMQGNVVLFSLEIGRWKMRLSFICYLVGFLQVAWFFLALSGALYVCNRTFGSISHNATIIRWHTDVQKYTKSNKSIKSLPILSWEFHLLSDTQTYLPIICRLFFNSI